MTDYTDLKARLGRSISAYELTGNGKMQHVTDMRQALAAIEELEARVERAKVQLLLIAYGSTETSVSSVAKATLAELETPNDRA